jgi:hypothetical protein
MEYTVSSKVDVTTGSYAKFLGITIVAHTHHSNKDFWNLIHNTISNTSLITNKYIPLPVDSYHMTYYDITTQRKTFNFGEFIKQNSTNFKKIVEDLKLFTNAKAKINSVVVERVIALNLELVDEKIIKDYEKEITFEHRNPSIFHVTLGYLRQNITIEECNKIHDFLKNNIDMMYELDFELPKLCYFNDMTQFIEFDGNSNPFE